MQNFEPQEMNDLFILFRHLEDSFEEKRYFGRLSKQCQKTASHITVLHFGKLVDRSYVFIRSYAPVTVMFRGEPSCFFPQNCMFCMIYLVKSFSFPVRSGCYSPPEFRMLKKKKVLLIQIKIHIFFI